MPMSYLDPIPEVPYDGFLSENEVSAPEVSEELKLWRANRHFYKVDVLSFGHLCNVVSNHHSILDCLILFCPSYMIISLGS